MRGNILKIRSAIVFAFLSVLSVAAFSSRAGAQSNSLTDSIGRLSAGVYQLETGSPYSPTIQIEIFNGGRFRLELFKMGAFTPLDIHHLFEGRIARKPTDDPARVEYALLPDAAWRVSDTWTGLFSAYITDTKLMQEPPEFSSKLSFNLRIEKSLGLLGRTIERAQLQIADATANEDFSLFVTRAEQWLRPPRRVSDLTFARFDSAPRAAIGSAAQASYACQQLFWTPAGFR